jgi:hypothetical protein
MHTQSPGFALRIVLPFQRGFQEETTSSNFGLSG